MADNWAFDVGTIATRKDVAERYGGATQGGIQPSASTANIMVYTDPIQGALSGYNYDGFDSGDENVFYYTGEGQVGDQELTNGNFAIYNHAEVGRTLRLFEAASGRQPGGKLQRYLGAFYVDTSNPFRFEPAPDRDGNARHVIVFRLIREGTVPADVEPSPPVPKAVRAQPQPTVPTGRNTREIDTDEQEEGAASRQLTSSADPSHYVADERFEVTRVPSEQSEVEQYQHAPRPAVVAAREEASLVRAFEAHLRAQGHEVGRVRVAIAGVKYSLVTDTYDFTARHLYEAKSSSDRASVRLAIGQLIDYLRFLPLASGGILLQAEPSPDLKELVWAAGFSVTYRRGGEWITE